MNFLQKSGLSALDYSSIKSVIFFTYYESDFSIQQTAVNLITLLKNLCSMCGNIHLLSLVFSIGIKLNETIITQYRYIDLLKC